MSIRDLDEHFRRYGRHWWNQNNCKGYDGGIKYGLDGYEPKFTVRDTRIELYGEPTLMRSSPVLLGTQTLENRTSTPQQQNITIGIDRSSTFSWSLQEGIKVGVKVSGKAKVKEIFEIGAEMSTEISFSASQTWTETVVRRFSVNQTVTVPPRKIVEAKLLVDELTLTQRFHAKTTLCGYVWIHGHYPCQGHYYWAIPITDIYRAFPEPGFTLSGDTVLYQGEGEFNGAGCVNARTIVTERQIDAPASVLPEREYTLDVPITGSFAIAAAIVPQEVGA
ncbi:MAG: ETX/MTX2 family pore-forming toxin [Acidobacteriota bacterium]